MKYINFFDNQLKNETGSALIDILRTNKNLTKIKLRFNRVQVRIVEEIKRLLKGNKDNEKMKFIPNLKREIRQNFINEGDFDQTDVKIQETGVNVRNVLLFYL